MFKKRNARITKRDGKDSNKGCQHSYSDASGFTPRPLRMTRLLEPTVPMSLTLRTLSRDEACSSLSGRGSACRCEGLAADDDDDRRAWSMTSSTHASLSGVMETRRDRGVGPARPSGCECICGSLAEAGGGGYALAPSPSAEDTLME